MPGKIRNINRVKGTKATDRWKLNKNYYFERANKKKTMNYN